MFLSQSLLSIFYLLFSTKRVVTQIFHFVITDEPVKEEIQTNITMLDNLIVADVMIEMVYPSPECSFVLDVGSDFDMTCHSITHLKSPCLHNIYVL